MIKIRSLISDDYTNWIDVYRHYADHYNVSLTKSSIAKTWSWLIDEAHPSNCIVAETNMSLVGLAHYRAMPSPLKGKNIGFLDDIIVKPSERGTIAAKLLFDELKIIGRRENWDIIRWITRDDNYRARSFYDKLASKTDWNMYEMSMSD
jgi:ribosomal protein S18 acetylase RimI-like enzyme